MDEPVITGRTTTRPLDDVVGEALSARVTIDERGTVTGWNAGAERLLGYAAEEVVGRPGAELLAERVPPEDLPPSRSCPDGTATSPSGTATAGGLRSRCWRITGNPGRAGPRVRGQVNGSWSPQ